MLNRNIVIQQENAEVKLPHCTSTWLKVVWSKASMSIRVRYIDPYIDCTLLTRTLTCTSLALTLYWPKRILIQREVARSNIAGSVPRLGSKRVRSEPSLSTTQYLIYWPVLYLIDPDRDPSFIDSYIILMYHTLIQREIARGNIVVAVPQLGSKRVWSETSLSTQYLILTRIVLFWPVLWPVLNRPLSYTDSLLILIQKHIAWSDIA